MVEKGVASKFKKLSRIYSVTINTPTDLLLLANNILNDVNAIVGSLKDIKEGDVALENELLKLLDSLRNENEGKSVKISKKLVYMVVSECISRSEVELWKILITRMYLRGIREILVQSFIKYLSKVAKEEEEEEYKELCVLSCSETTRGICCKVLKYLAKFLYIEKVNEEYIVCVDNHKYYNMIRRTISIMTSSIAKGTNTPIGYELFTLFHPYNQANISCLIKFMMIDVFTDEVKMNLLRYMAMIYADPRLTKPIHVNLVAYLAACMSRILHYTKIPPNFQPLNLSILLTKGITENLQTLDPMRRLTAKTVAEAYSVFLNNNSTSTNESMLLNFRKKHKVVTPIMMYLGAHKSKVVINPNFAKMKKESGVRHQEEEALESSDNSVNQEQIEIERASSNEEQIELEIDNHNEAEYEREKSREGEGDCEDKGFMEIKRISEEENEGEEDIESYEESEDEYRADQEIQKNRERKQEIKNQAYKEENSQTEEKGENKAFLDFIFQGVPSIKAKTVEGRVKETWLKPPQHIVQCYERLLSKPARGDVDFERINEDGLDRLEDETVENKILRVSQTLIWLPKVISKKETILEKYAVPLSSLLLKLEDLDLYKEKIEEIIGSHSSKVSESLSEIIEVVSKDPEELIMASLVLMSFHSPYEVLRHYTDHLFDREITLASRLKMMLCIQYTLMGYLEQMDDEELTKKVLQRGVKFNVENENGVERLETSIESKVEGKIEVKLSEGAKEVKEKRKETWRPSKTMIQKYLETTTMCLLNSMKIYKKKREGGEDVTDEEVAATIVQTIAILIKINEKKSENEGEIEEMVEYFSKIEGGIKFKDSVKMVEEALKTRQIMNIESMK